MIAAASSLRQTTTALASLGVPLPADIEELLEMSNRLQVTATERANVTAESAAAEITPDNLTDIFDQLVRACLEADLREQTARQLAEALAGRAVQSLRHHADDLIRAGRAGFDRAVQQIAEGRDAYDPNESADQVLGRGPSAAEKWLAIGQASETLDQYRHLWSLLTESPFSADTVVASFNGDWWLRVDAEEALSQSSPWHRLIRMGLDLRFNTRAEAAANAATPPKTLRAENVWNAGLRSVQQVRA